MISTKTYIEYLSRSKHVPCVSVKVKGLSQNRFLRTHCCVGLDLRKLDFGGAKLSQGRHNTKVCFAEIAVTRMMESGVSVSQHFVLNQSFFFSKL
jgi:hypothetical protein